MTKKYFQFNELSIKLADAAEGLDNDGGHGMNLILQPSIW
jgi:hypothetical protein